MGFRVAGYHVWNTVFASRVVVSIPLPLACFLTDLPSLQDGIILYIFRYSMV